ncbi:PolC-type DNA polymerase III [Mycoplasmopsis agalactiae]|uniref:DNA polymerase III PolC-type n=1 Tax=Mycoplasmopsis agalactiae TaxID=2110 RepID=D3VQ26_MYCAA|nr:PolC-type DNA polymerase III [Mycoplasmopsis agalactiae]KAB6718770.1 PolC-type DNA polymerase III [Mycoplasmopsis agalactiae]CBH40301.1 DNA polymerase III alpha subunit [Mycoplasmopsis agalactiae]
MSSVGYKRFEAFCKANNIEINSELQGTELVLFNQKYDENSNEKLKIEFRFKNPISYETIKKLKSFIRLNKDRLDVSFVVSNDSYNKNSILQYVYQIIDKTRFKPLNQINWENKFYVDEDHIGHFENIDRDFENQYGILLSKLLNKLKEYGFALFNFSYDYIQSSPESYSKLEEAAKQNEKIKQELLKKMIELDSSSDKYDSYDSNPLKVKRNFNKSYTTYSIKDLATAPSRINVEFVGLLFASKKSFSKNKKLTIQFKVSDFQSAVNCTWFLDTDWLSNEQKNLINPDNQSWVKVKGSIPSADKIKGNNFFIYVDSLELTDSPLNIKEDIASEDRKRVEFHISTKMNTMDGLFNADDFVERAKRWKMPAVGIMDTDGAQGYPKLFNKAKKAGIKAIYGTAFTTINKANEAILGNAPNGNFKDYSYVSFDIETTGLSPKFHEIIEFGAVDINQDLKVGKVTQFFIKPQAKIGAFTTELTGITQQMLDSEGLSIKDGLQRIYDCLDGKVAIAHNAKFDFNFLKEQFRLNNVPFPNVTVIDTLIASRIGFPNYKRHKLEDVASRLGVVYDPNVAHRGDYDAKVLANVWVNIISELNSKNIFTFEDLGNFTSNDLYAKMHGYEVSTIALNNKGLKKQFELITDCLTKKFINGPITFKEDFVNLDRSDILVGSGTLKGLLIDKYFYSSHDDFIKELKHYDFIEIPAPQCFEHWIKYGFITTKQLYDGLSEIISEAKKHSKICIATADVKYLDPWDKEIFMSLVYAKGIKNARHYLFDYKKAEEGKLVIPNQRFLTTDEMLEQFAFLNDKKLAEEIVIDNTQKIANMAENIEVIKNGLFTPEFDDSKKKLHDLVYKNAHAKYGENLPELIQKRIDSELNPIIKYGFDVIYWISYKLVKLSIDQGFIVGSRGSIGSSFVASLIGISEVNPLVPHYCCPKCKHFEIANVPGITSGYDLPDKICPQCNTKIKGDGQSIPFETFLGFNADKVPDIDLNFTGEFQGVVHEEIRKLFGESHTFRAGTISKVAEKTAFGYVKSYAEQTRQNIPQIFVEFLANRIKDVKRTTGQHPGGIIIIPKQFDIFDFTPINYPANDQSSSWLTTHFDYKAIHDNVLKFDILGHDNPTSIKLLEQYTGINIYDVPKNDESVIKLFSSTEPMGIKPDQISNEKTGAIGLPEFGTSFVRQMLNDIKPKTVADLISISGLSHGTNVWINNADELVLEKCRKLNEVVCCRDDIMPMLIAKGIEPLLSFTLMEKVRKGKGLSNEEVGLLEKHNVPNWLIKSMQKIEYLFPKAHATAYVTMALWIAWFKLYEPLAFYASYFTAHSKADDIENMIDKPNGIKVSKRLYELKKTEDRSNKENDLIGVFEVAEELYARGFYISNVDIDKSQAEKWLIDKERGCLIPPFSTIESLGSVKANDIVNARAEKAFLSKEDFKIRTGVSKTVFDTMNRMKILDSLNDSDQLTLF